MAEPRHDVHTDAPPGLQAWRRLVEKGLKDRPFSSLQSQTRDGIVIEPLYPARLDVSPLPGRGARPWRIVQIVDLPDPNAANRQALAEVAGGATGLALRLAGAPLATGTGLPFSPEDLALTLDGIDLAAIQLRLDPHPRSPEIVRAVADLVARHGVAPELTDIAFGLDPVAPILAGQPPAAGDKLVDIFEELRAAGFRGGIAELDARPFHEAGATEAQELAIVLASAVWWLRALQSRAVPAEAALPFFGASLPVNQDQLLSIAKLRALRLLWARLGELCGAEPSRLKMHAETSRRMTARAAPHTNLVRATIAAFAAGIGGGDSIAVLPFTAAAGPADAAARALARNTQHLLLEESHLHRVDDPAAGSGAIEALTDALAEGAWGEFQKIERDGGIMQSLSAGSLQERILAAREALRAEIASGAAPLVGSTVFRDASEPSSPSPLSHLSGALLAPIRLEELAEGG